MLQKKNYSDDILHNIRRLSEVNEQRDIKPLMATSFPGTHCPLMGVLMTVRQMPEVVTVIIGTDECTYYSKLLANMKIFGSLKESCVSVVIDDYDVTFGTIKKTKKAVAEIFEAGAPKCIVLVTTCVLEIIGDDYDALVDELEEKYHIPVLLVRTEHFQCRDHLPGIERTLTATVKLMRKMPTENVVNILGNGAPLQKNSALLQLLEQAGVQLGLQLPGKGSLQDLALAGRAKLNIVVDELGLELAKQMQARLAVPYVYFPPMCNPQNILQAYKELAAALAVELPPAVTEAWEKCLALQQQVREKLQGAGYIYGNSPFNCWELNTYLAALGLKPLMIQMSTLKNKEAKKELLQYADPYICKSANLAAMEFVYDKLKPQLYIGRSFTDSLERKGIFGIDSMPGQDVLGFAGCFGLLKRLLDFTQTQIEEK